VPRARGLCASLALLLGCAAARGGSGAVVAQTARPAAPSPDASADAQVYRVSDAHLHFVDFLQQTEGMEAAIAALDAAGIDHAMITGMPFVKKWSAADPRRPLYYLEDDSPVYWYSATDVLVARAVKGLPPDQRRRLHPFISGFNATDRNAVDHVERMLEWYPGLWEGIGEVMARHDDLTALSYGEAPRADHVALDAVYELAADRDLPVAIHSNVGSVWLRKPIYLHELENALKRHPKTRFIWCHAGVSRRIDIPTLAHQLRRLLSSYRNLWIDLSWVVLETHVAPGGDPDPEWVALIESFPDRFMIGSDAVGRFAELPDQIHRYYVLLDALAPETADRVARENFLGVLPQRVRTDLNNADPLPAAGR